MGGGIGMAFKVTHCIYDLRDQYNNLLNCPVLEKIGKAVKVEDMPKYCEVCPMRIISLGPHPHPPGPHLPPSELRAQ